MCVGGGGGGRGYSAIEPLHTYIYVKGSLGIKKPGGLPNKYEGYDRPNC